MNRIIFLMTILILLSSCSSQPNLNEPKSQHTDLSYPEAEKRGYVVAGPSGVANVDLLENFFQDYQNKKTNKVTIARYTDEGIRFMWILFMMGRRYCLLTIIHGMHLVEDRELGKQVVLT